MRRLREYNRVDESTLIEYIKTTVDIMMEMKNPFGFQGECPHCNREIKMDDIEQKNQ